MAKSKFKVTKNEPETPADKTEAEIQPLAKDEEVEEVKEEIKTVIGVTQAEQLQKSGWQLLSVTQTSNGKEFKFKKGK